jgi:glutaredoxin
MADLMAARVVLYSKPGCHLCEDARGLLDGWGIVYEVIESDPRYDLRVPVVELDGRVIAEAPIDENALARALGAGRRGRV